MMMYVFSFYLEGVCGWSDVYALGFEIKKNPKKGSVKESKFRKAWLSYLFSEHSSPSNGIVNLVPTE